MHDQRPRVRAAVRAEPPDPLRILYLANGFPWPLTSGYLRHYFLIRELARRGHRISLLTIVPTGFEPADRAEAPHRSPSGS